LREALPAKAFRLQLKRPGCPAWTLLCSIEQFYDDWRFL
jgi:hypothetical protein